MDKQFKNREIKKQALYDYLTSDTIQAQIQKKYSLPGQTINHLYRMFIIELKFDENKFFELLKNDISRLTTRQMMTKFSFSKDAVANLRKGHKVNYKKLIQMIRKYGIDYELELLPNPKRLDIATVVISVNGFVEEKEPTMKRGAIYLMTSEEKKEYNEKISILDNQRKHLVEKLYAKGLSVETIGTIMSSMNVIAREALLIGVMAEKNGYGNKIEYAIARKVEER